jgi:hypothetical protein
MKTLVFFTFCFAIFCIIHWKWFRAGIEQWCALGYSTCEKCDRPWKFVNGHSIMYNDYQGTFAVCDECWANSTLDELKKYYTEVYQMQLKQGMKDDHYKALINSVEKNFNHDHKIKSE